MILSKRFSFMAVLAFVGLLFGATGCEQCEQCTGSVVVESFLADSLISVANSDVSSVQYCGDDLDVLKANPVVTQETEQTTLGITQRIVSTTTWTCQ